MADTRRITQSSIEVQVQLDGDVRITQEAAEIIMDPLGIRATQEWIEVIADSRFGGIEPVVIVVDSGRTAPASGIIE